MKELLDYNIKKKDLSQYFVSRPNGIYLKLRGLDLETIPEWIYEIKNLRYLDLSFNKIEELDDRINELDLYYINLGRNNLKSIPNCLQDTGLKRLDIHSNKLGNINIDMPKLLHLNMSNCGITKFPQINSPKLMYLSLYLNKLKIIPNEICKLNNLQELLLGFNMIEHIPENIGDLKKLQVFIIHSNKLTIIPNSLFTISNKHHFDYENQEKTTPNIITNTFTVDMLSEPKKEILWDAKSSIDDIEYRDLIL